MSLKGKSLYVMTPMYGGNLTMNYHDSFVQLVAACAQLGVPFSWSNVFNESLVSRARNRLVDSFLKTSTHTHALFIDADIGFDPMDVITMLELDKDIVGVPCSKKSIRWDRVQLAVARRAFEWMKHTKPPGDMDPIALADNFRRSQSAIDPALFPRIAGDYVLNYHNFETKEFIHVDQPEEMRLLGTGMLMIKREVFQKFKKCYPDRWYESRSDANSNPGPIHDFFKVGVDPQTREYDSEDYWFCKDAATIGYKILMLPWVKTTHMGTFTYVGDLPAALATTGEIL
jgi:hypothetical protein